MTCANCHSTKEWPCHLERVGLCGNPKNWEITFEAKESE